VELAGKGTGWGECARSEIKGKTCFGPFCAEKTFYGDDGKEAKLETDPDRLKNVRDQRGLIKGLFGKMDAKSEAKLAATFCAQQRF
jgi:hypothetical protein